MIPFPIIRKDMIVAWACIDVILASARIDVVGTSLGEQPARLVASDHAVRSAADGSLAAGAEPVIRSVNYLDIDVVRLGAHFVPVVRDSVKRHRAVSAGPQICIPSGSARDDIAIPLAPQRGVDDVRTGGGGDLVRTGAVVYLVLATSTVHEIGSGIVAKDQVTARTACDVGIPSSTCHFTACVRLQDVLPGPSSRLTVLPVASISRSAPGPPLTAQRYPPQTSTYSSRAPSWLAFAASTSTYTNKPHWCPTQTSSLVFGLLTSAIALNLTPQRDVYSAGGGDDTVHALAGNDEVSGDAGSDDLYGDADQDELRGGDGWGGPIQGGDGWDDLQAGAGKNDLDGENGEDILSGSVSGTVNDLNGGADDDILDARNGTVDDMIKGGGGTDTCYIDNTPLGNQLANSNGCEKVRY